MDLRTHAGALWRSRVGWAAAGLLSSAAAVTAATGVVLGLDRVAPALSLGVVYLVAVLPVAAAWGLVYALPVAVASMLAFNFFFLPPLHTLRLRQAENWVALAVYLAGAVLVSHLAAVTRRRAQDAEQRGREASFAADVAALLLDSGFVQERVREIAARVAGVLGVERARIELESLRRPQAGETGLPLTVGERHVGMLFLDEEARPDAAVAGRILPALAALLAAALDRERLALKAVEAESLRRSDAVKTTILRAVSHDLRSPLTAISAAAEVLDEARTSVAAAERAELVASIRLESARLERLVSNLLDLSRLEAGAAHPRPELWTADGLVARALSALGEAGGRVDVELPPEPAAVRADPAQVERALVNLLENGLQASAGGDHVVLRVERTRTEVVWRVLDRGPGFDPDEAERIFRAFERGSGELRTGAGLGLTIARGFAEANGGRVWAERPPGGGAAFALALPAVRVPEAVGA